MCRVCRHWHISLAYIITNPSTTSLLTTQKSVISRKIFFESSWIFHSVFDDDAGMRLRRQVDIFFDDVVHYYAVSPPVAQPWSYQVTMVGSYHGCTMVFWDPKRIMNHGHSELLTAAKSPGRYKFKEDSSISIVYLWLGHSCTSKNSFASACDACGPGTSRIRDLADPRPR